MLKERYEPDFIGTGQSMSEEDSARVSAWIKEQKEKQKKKTAATKKRTASKRSKAA